MENPIPPMKIFQDHAKKLSGIFVDDQYLYTWGPGYIPEGDSYPKDTVYIYDKRRNFALDGMLVGHGQDIACVASDSKHIFVGGGGGKDLTGYRYSVLRSYDKTTQLLQDDEGGDEYRAVSLFNDGTHLFMGTDDGLIIVHDLETLRSIVTMWPEQTRTCAEVIFADDTHVYAAGNDASLIVWDNQKFKHQSNWKGSTKNITHITGFKGHLFSSDWNGEIGEWDTKTGTLITKWLAHTGSVTGLISLGSNLISCGQDQLIKVWSADKYKELQTLQHHPAPVVALIVDESFLYAGYTDGVVVGWQLSQVLERIREL